MQSEFLIKKIEASDAADVVEIAATCQLSEWTRDDYAAEASRDDAVLVGAFSNGGLLGFISARISPSASSTEGQIIEIFNIGVSPKNRRNGVGRALMKHLIKLAVKHSVRSLWLEVREGNSTAISFYRSFGFTGTARRPDFYHSPSEAAVLMTADTQATSSTISQQCLPNVPGMG